MKKLSQLCFLLCLSGPTLAETARVSPEDAILSDALLAPATESAPIHPYVASSFLAGDDGFWTAELEVGAEFPSGWQLSVLAARSQVGATSTNDGWLNASYLFRATHSWASRRCTARALLRKNIMAASSPA